MMENNMATTNENYGPLQARCNVCFGECLREDCGSNVDKSAKKKCKNCGYNYQDPKYCSVWGRTADKHEWI